MAGIGKIDRGKAFKSIKNWRQTARDVHAQPRALYHAVENSTSERVVYPYLGSKYILCRLLSIGKLLFRVYR